MKNCIENTRRKNFGGLCIYSGVILNRKLHDSGVVLCTGLQVFVFLINIFTNVGIHTKTCGCYGTASWALSWEK